MPIRSSNPRRRTTWEAMATFNAAAVALEDRIHLLYRAGDTTDTPVLGYATSTDGIHIDERLDYPVYDPTDHRNTETQDRKFIRHSYMSGGGTGLRRPALTRIDNTLYLTYTAFNGMQPPGVALTSISIRTSSPNALTDGRSHGSSRASGHIQKLGYLSGKIGLEKSHPAQCLAAHHSRGRG